MRVEIYVINDCPYCDNLLKVLPDLVKKYPEAEFLVTSNNQIKFDMYPTVVVAGKILSPCIYVEKLEKEVKNVLT